MIIQPKHEIFTLVVLEVFKVVGQLNIDGDNMSREFNLTASRWKVLGTIGLSKQLLTVSEISRHVGQSRQAVQRLVDIMLDDGLLIMEENPNHKRAKYIKLTKLGQKIHERLYVKQIDWAKKYSADIDKKNLERTLEVLKQISR
ncbi:MarR family winged helix-turn-helix transcriptional regulator [Neptuniibacter caesariensis]|uniref:Transcriptional regulator, MarR family protein n=1 Tax=Neptuniibacter caesariensis TaxID=207954 RepID=A0A7U8C4Z8_NEPCE|nr:MarR family transcriptional regulator [Neptuniibacter caesariensis]EAR61319.1 transcriptional regulator, MarR family protein [Oceanospirillum sp. MED92] [Neptuniibacter caesariensis]